MKPIILITGFDAFGGQELNPTEEIIKQLPNQVLGWQIETRILSTVFGKASQQLEYAISQLHPTYVIAMGQAGGRQGITIERVAINIDDARIPDNEGHQPIDQPISLSGQPAYFATLPIKRMVKSLNDHSITASVSNTAGTYVCNHVMYRLLEILSKSFPYTKGGFIHVPYLPSQVETNTNLPSMALSEMVKALEIVIQTMITEGQENDIQSIGGLEH